MKPQKKGAKPSKTNSNPKREGKKTPAPTPAPAPKKPSGKASKPSRGRVKVDRAEVSVEVEAGGAAPKKAAEKPAPAPAPAAAPAAEEPSLVAPAKKAEPEASAPAVEATDAAVAPAEEAEAFPAPGERRVVFEVPDALWQELSPDTLAVLHQPREEARVTWFNRDALVVSAATEAADAVAIGCLLDALGLRCVEPRAGVQDQGLEVDVWAVGRRAERQGAAA